MKNALLWVPRKVKWVVVACFSDIRNRTAKTPEPPPEK
jgi:hypothetical protein